MISFRTGHRGIGHYVEIRKLADKPPLPVKNRYMQTPAVKVNMVFPAIARLIIPFGGGAPNGGTTVAYSYEKPA